MTPSARSPSATARPITRSSPASDSSMVRLTLALLWDSLALRKQLISRNLSRCASAFSKPRSLGISTVTSTSSGTSMRASTSAPSASCGMTSARTNDVTSSRLTPVRASRPTRRTLSSVAMTSGSFWKPSRGPTSRMRTSAGRAMSLGAERAGDDHLLDLVGALADGEDLRVAVHAAHRVLLDVAVAAVDLHGLLGRAHGQPAGLQLGLRGGQREG